MASKSSSSPARLGPDNASSTPRAWGQWDTGFRRASAHASRADESGPCASMATADSNSTSRSWRRSSRLRLPIKFFVLNNDGYASIRASQIDYFGRASIGCDARTGLTVPDLSKIAAAYGLPTAVISDQSELRRQVRSVLHRPGPVVCDVHVIPDEVRAPRLSSMQRPDGSFVSKPLEDLWPFLDRDELFSNMIVRPVAD